MTPIGDEYVLAVPVERVRAAINELLGRNVHQFFPAYLALVRQSQLQATTEDIDPKWAELGSFLYVEGSLPERPYLRPFWDGQHNAGQEWLNKNLAGSYAPSSLRGVPLNVIDITPEKRFALRPNHPQLALQHLLKGSPIPAVAVAAFMLRDRAISGPLIGNGAIQLVEAFGREFGYRNSDFPAFKTLFDIEWGAEDEVPWLERFWKEDQP
jgi:hypothetical protein